VADARQPPKPGKNKTEPAQAEPRNDPPKPPAAEAKGKKAEEIGGPKGPEPTRYGDWERKGIAVDF